ncbi:MFS general substrate transporter [Nadsonia fulvescens var. elongata DSM 6958]|uniref:Probable transporter MCH1 n=1 Tax=Nadsonia fulvescens var. elongata DSM 6958 TaxID=857566 RepID=A0A1E3PMR2_9ASCO|nr:MFS general substrate transporter [Nadsonia fulvescens var. elongata DSM 6958]
MPEETSPLLKDASTKTNYSDHRRNDSVPIGEEASSIEYITFEGPNILSSTRRWTYYFISVLCALSCASIMLFSIYAPSLQTRLGLSQLQINYISIFAEVGQYLPFFGFIADVYGAHVITIISIFCLTPTYLVAGFIYSNPNLLPPSYNLRILCACFFGIGAGSSSLFLGSFFTCTRLFPSNRILSISVPVASFGLSSFLEAQLTKIFIHETYVDVNGIFVTFAGMFLLTGISSTVTAYKSRTPVIDKLDASSTNKGSRLKKIFKEPTPWLLFLALLVSAGPIEMFVNNIGSLVLTLPDTPKTADQVSYFAIFSTAARLLSGVICHYIPLIKPAPLLTSILMVTALVHLSFAMEILPSSCFSLVSMINGWAYGSCFTIFPTMVMIKYGLSDFGSVWNCVMMSPAIGCMIFGVIYGKVYDRASFEPSNNALLLIEPLIKVFDTNQVVCLGPSCYQITFVSTAGSILVGALIILAVYKGSLRNSKSSLPVSFEASA